MRSHCGRTRLRCILEDRASHIEAFTHGKRMTVDLAVIDAQVEACYPAMRELRPHLDAHTFVRLVRELQRSGQRVSLSTFQGCLTW